MRKSLLLLLIFSSLYVATAQPTSKFSLEEKLNFALEVKQIDEFIERFNYQENTLLLQYVEENYPGKMLDRVSLIQSLFNEQSNWNTSYRNAFVNQVTNPLRPIVIDFMEDDWFAAVQCSVLFRGKVVTPTLILQIQQGPDFSSKWIIKSVRADFFRFPSKSNPEHFLNPISHSTDFMGLRRAMNNKEHLPDYAFEDFEPDLLSIFMYELMNGNIEFLQVNSITYHFLQVNGWIFQVKKHLRNSRNSGWLIDQLRPADEPTKTTYRRNVLSLR
ncbi:MAG: hypothetical protein AAF587_07750 [Bacteroidota bacterium]